MTLTSDGHMTRRCLTFAFPTCGDQGLGHVTRDIGAGHHAEEQCPHICWVVTVLLNSDPEKKKLLHPKSIPTSQYYYCTLIFNNFEMFRKKLFEIKPQTGGVNA